MTRDQLARIALRYDTLMSCAMLRALGVDRPPRKRKGKVIVSGGRPDRYGGMRECMMQRYGVRP